MAHAREEYLFQYSIYVLESCTSRRLTYFLPPTNLIPLLFVRPLRLFLPSDTVRSIRVVLLRAVSAPFVALIWFYEGAWRLFGRDDRQRPLGRIRSRPLSTGNPSYGMLVPHFHGTGKAQALTRSDPPHKENLGTSSGDTTMRWTDNHELVSLIQKLSAQVEELTAVVTAQKTD